MPSPAPVSLFSIAPSSTNRPVTSSTTTTIVTTSTSTLTTTQTSTPTQTITIATPSPFYAACATNNLVSTLPDGTPIGTVFARYAESIIVVDSGYDCCVACQTTAGCGSSAFEAGLCFMDLDAGDDTASCNPNSVVAGFAAMDGSNFVVSNSGCGQSIWQKNGIGSGF